MDETLRTKIRKGLARSIDLKRVGYPIVHAAGPIVLELLKEAGWHIFPDEPPKRVKGVDCRGWMHCGPECCGTCRICGDRGPSKLIGKPGLVVCPPSPMSRKKAKSTLYKIMESVTRGTGL